MSEFKNVMIIKKANIYFDGKVASRSAKSLIEITQLKTRGAENAKRQLFVLIRQKGKGIPCNTACCCTSGSAPLQN